MPLDYLLQIHRKGRSFLKEINLPPETSVADSRSRAAGQQRRTDKEDSLSVGIEGWGQVCDTAKDVRGESLLIGPKRN